MQIPIRNIFYLLCYAWSVLDIAEDAEVAALEANNMENLLAHVLSLRMRALLKHGIERDYSPFDQDSKYPSGRIDFQVTTKRMLLARREVHIRTDELSFDTLANQIIKSSIKILLEFNGLSKLNRGELAGLFHRLQQVASRPLNGSDFTRVRYHRNNREYRVLLSICEMVHTLSMPDEQGSGKRFIDFVRDEKRMWKVFQEFVFNFYKKRQTFYKVNADAFPWQQSKAHHNMHLGLPRLQTDIVLSSPISNFVIDTKFYSNPFPVSHGRPQLNPEHINQVFAYVQNLEWKKGWQSSLTGVLLYAGVGDGFCLKWTLFGRPLIVAAVDLSKQWFEIEKQLLTLVGLPGTASSLSG